MYFVDVRTVAQIAPVSPSLWLRALCVALLCFAVVACGGSGQREVDIAAKNGILLRGNGAEPK